MTEQTGCATSPSVSGRQQKFLSLSPGGLLLRGESAAPPTWEPPPCGYCRSRPQPWTSYFSLALFSPSSCLAPTSTLSAVHQSISAHFSSPAAEAILRPATRSVPSHWIDCSKLPWSRLPQQAPVQTLLEASPTRPAHPHSPRKQHAWAVRYPPATS